VYKFIKELVAMISHTSIRVIYSVNHSYNKCYK